jgi:flagellar M-ring protein FliF
MRRFDLQKIKDRFNDAFKEFTRGQKAMMGLAVGVVVIGMFIFTQSQGGEKMAPLFTHLEAGDASAVTSKLDAQKVSYKLADQGTTVLVPVNDVYRLRLSLNAENIPSGGGESFALLDKEGITTSTFKQRTDYQRALAGELGRTIQAMDSVDQARVNLVIPTDDVFSADSQKATASVLIKTKGTAQLSREQINSVAHLVASSVPQLSPDNVTITDSNGRALWFGGDDANQGNLMTGEQQAQTAAFEQKKSKAIEDLIGTVLGAEKVKATVSAELDFTQKETQSTQFSNTNVPGSDPLIDNTSRHDTTYSGVAAGTVGPLGPDGQPLVPVTGTNGATTAPAMSEKQDQTKYALNQVNQVAKDAPGTTIKHMNVAVAIDQAHFNVADQSKVEALVRQAAGVIEPRDQMSVIPLAFDTTAATNAKKELASPNSSSEGASDLFRGVAVIALILAAVGLGLWALKKSRQPQVEVIDLRELEAMRLAELESGVPSQHELSALEEPMQLTVGHDGELFDSLPTEEELLERNAFEDPWDAIYAAPPAAALVESMEAEINGLVDSQSEDVAALLRNWLGDRRTVSR